MKKKWKLIPALLMVLLLGAGLFFGGKAFGENEVRKEDGIKEETLARAWRSHFAQFDFGTDVTYVIGHMSPDTDAVMSAISMAELLRELGVNAVPATVGEISKETEYYLDEFGVKAPQILEDARGKQLWLVDNNTCAQSAEGIEEARIVGITDHHGVGDVQNSEQIHAESGPYLSTTEAVYQLYKRYGVTVTPIMAEVMLAGMFSDGKYMANEHSELADLDYEELVKLAGFDEERIGELHEGSVNAKYDREGKSDTEIFYSDYKKYEAGGTSYGIGNISVYSQKEIPEMTARMQEVLLQEIETCEEELLVACIYDSGYQEIYMAYAAKDEETGKAVMEEAFGAEWDKEGEFYHHMPSVARRDGIAPNIESTMKNK